MATAMEANNETIDLLKEKVTAKLTELDPSNCFDSTLIDYILVMVVNQKSKFDMKDNLALFLKDISDEFVDWLFNYLAELKLGANNIATSVKNVQQTDKDEDKTTKTKEEKQQQSNRNKRPSKSEMMMNNKKNLSPKSTHKSKHSKESSRKTKRDSRSPSSSSSSSYTSSSSTSSNFSSRSRSPPPPSRNKDRRYHNHHYHNKNSSRKDSEKIRLEKQTEDLKPVVETIPEPVNVTVVPAKPKRRLKSTIIPTGDPIVENNTTTQIRRLKRPAIEEKPPQYGDGDEAKDIPPRPNSETTKEPRPAKKLRPVVEIVENESMMNNVDVDAVDEEELMPTFEKSTSSEPTKFYVTLDGVKMSDMFKGNDDLLLMEDEEFDPELMNEDELIESNANHQSTSSKRKYQKSEKNATGTASIGTKKSERCRYWPTCANGERCEYHHPVIKCNLFPFCRFGDKCLYKHPICKFDALCTRKDCPYFHTSGGGKHGGFRATVPMIPVSSLPHHQITCKFFPNCTNPTCEFLHPKNCHYGFACKTFNCPFAHPTPMAASNMTNLPHPSQLKWSSSSKNDKPTGMVRNWI